MDPIVTFHTNLDRAKHHVPGGLLKPWLGPVPRVGDEIRLDVTTDRFFCLRVCQVTWSQTGERVHVELHLPTYPTRSIKEWDDWFRDWIEGGR